MTLHTYTTIQLEQEAHKPHPSPEKHVLAINKLEQNLQLYKQDGKKLLLSPLEKHVVFHSLNLLESPLPNFGSNCLSGSGEEDENLTVYRQTNRWTDGQTDGQTE